MPIYEYQCTSCGAVFQRLIFKTEEEADLKCPKCGREEGHRRLISRVVYHVSERARLAAYDPKAKGDSFYKDTRNIGLEAKKRAQRMGVDLGHGFEEKLEKLRTDPGSVLKESE